ncbi:hypothetical protein SJAV_03780 [Sulfurisphaera javensis]|uniref:Uncharacterized protein n=1 Tax=Sulfurisphaera javensis TaxID=2049879 RepID=A0AAT9GNS0_9CREN
MFIDLSILCSNKIDEFRDYEIELFSGIKPFYIEDKKIKINIIVIEFLTRYYSFCDILYSLILYINLKMRIQNKKEIILEIINKYHDYLNIITDFIAFYQ